MNKNEKGKKIKLFYVMLNGGLNVATPSQERAEKSIQKILSLMKSCDNKDWKIEVRYD